MVARPRSRRKCSSRLTGLSLVGFLCVHLAGNLLLYFGPAKFNAYSHALISNPLVIPLELGLLAIFLLHVLQAVTNWWSDRRRAPGRLPGEARRRRPQPEVGGVERR